MLLDKDFMQKCKNDGITVQTIHLSNLNFLDRIRFLKLVGKDFDKERTVEEQYFHQNLTIKIDYLVDTIYRYFDKFSEKEVVKAMIKIVGTESRGKSGASLFEGFKIKKEPYNNVYIFNVIYEFGNIEMLDDSVQKDGTYATIIRTKNYPTKEQLVCMLITPELIEKDSFDNDLGRFNCFKTNFDVNDIYNKWYKTKKNINHNS
jgi:hypothetical protein